MAKQVWSDLYQLLQEIRTRPAMWIPSGSLEELETFICGYVCAVSAHGVQEFGTNFNMRFREHLSKKYGWTSPSGWHRIIAEHCDSPAEAWDRFFEIVDDFGSVASISGGPEGT